VWSFTTSPPTAPGAPTNVTATAGNGQATVSFNPPLSDGGNPITSYIVNANPGNITKTNSSSPFSPITFSGLTNSTAYTFTVQATNAAGTGPAATAANLNRLSVTINGTGSGSVNSSPSGISCTNGTCSNDFNFGSTFNLLPSASAGSQFSGWSGPCTVTGSSCGVTLNSLYQSVTATFNTLHNACILGSPQFYGLLQLAYNAAATGAVIQSQGITFTENLAMGISKAVTLKGGFDPTFSTQNGYTILQGSLTISQGSLVADHLIIE
jgi:hypothetical protein